jgi:putative glutamine transport system substrate-binding protein
MMKQAILFAIIFIASLTSCELAGPPSSKNTTYLDKVKIRGRLIVGTDYAFPGMGYLNLQTNEVEGFEPDLARLIAKEILGDEKLIEFIPIIPNNRIPYLQSEIVDLVIANMTITEERKKVIDFSDVYYVTGQSILVKTGTPIISVQDLNGKKVGTGSATTNETTLKKLAPEANIVPFEDITAGFRALENGEIDALSSDAIILSILRTSSDNPNDYQIVGGQLTTEPWGIGLEKGNSELLNLVNETLKKVKKDGEWTQLYNKNLSPITGLSNVAPP